MLRTLTSIFSSILTASRGWLTRPQDMSVMWSRPSMPPRSTNAPKSAMFLTVPLTSLASSRSAISFFASPRSFFDELAAADDDVATLGVDLEDLGADLRPMNSPMSCGRRISTCEAGRKTGTPMSTSRPPLIFACTLPSTMSPSLVVSTIALPVDDAVGLALGELDQPAQPGRYRRNRISKCTASGASSPISGRTATG
jgi:hypothetical protein